MGSVPCPLCARVVLARPLYGANRDRGFRRRGSQRENLVGHVFKHAVFDIKQHIITKFSFQMSNYTQDCRSGSRLAVKARPLTPFPLGIAHDLYL